MTDQQASPVPSWRDGLTPRQIKVCELIAKGLSTKEVAGSLGVSHRTIEDHRSAAKKALGVRNAVEITRKVLGIDVS